MSVPTLPRELLKRLVERRGCRLVQEAEWACFVAAGPNGGGPTWAVCERTADGWLTHAIMEACRKVHGLAIPDFEPPNGWTIVREPDEWEIARLIAADGVQPYVGGARSRALQALLDSFWDNGGHVPDTNYRSVRKAVIAVVDAGLALPHWPFDEWRELRLIWQPHAKALPLPLTMQDAAHLRCLAMNREWQFVHEF